MKRLLVFLLPVLIISDTYIDKLIPPVSSGYQVDQVDSGWTIDGVWDCSYFDFSGDIVQNNQQVTYGHFADPCVGADCTDATQLFAFFLVSEIDDPTHYNNAYNAGEMDITGNLLDPTKCQVYKINATVSLQHDRNVTCDPASTEDLGGGYCVCLDGYIPSPSSITSCDPIPADRLKSSCVDRYTAAVASLEGNVSAYRAFAAETGSTSSFSSFHGEVIAKYASECSLSAIDLYARSHIYSAGFDPSTVVETYAIYLDCALLCMFDIVYEDVSGTTDTTATTDTTTTDTTTTDTTTTGTTTNTTTTTDTTTDTTTIDTTTTDTTTDLAETNDILRDILDAGGESAAESYMSYLDNMSQFLDDLSQSSDNIEQSYNDLRDVLDGTYTTNFTTSSQCTITFTPFNSPIDVDMCKWSYIVRPWVVFITTLFLLYFLIRLHIYLFVHLIRR